MMVLEVRRRIWLNSNNILVRGGLIRIRTMGVVRRGVGGRHRRRRRRFIVRGEGVRGMLEMFCIEGMWRKLCVVLRFMNCIRFGKRVQTVVVKAVG